MNTIVLVTGGFDPLHSGHIAYFNAAKDLGDYLVVGVNSDEWLERKKGRAFMPWNERAAIIEALGCVDQVIEFDDSNDSATEAIKYVLNFWKSGEKIIFANGGDRTEGNILEMLSVTDPRLSFKFGVGGEDKKNSSSWILTEWKAPKTKRDWGYYRVIHEYDNHTKVKELTVDSGKRLSMQRHKQRSEHWFVAEGTATVYTIDTQTTDYELYGVFEQHKSLHISTNEWHQLSNETDKPLRVVEIQYGENCIEEDIERQ
jgi:D-beta-D-heptose 7-phosphate kinase/D-beta-D-heptose 1-phosphate adenosyltransferase